MSVGVVEGLAKFGGSEACDTAHGVGRGEVHRALEVGVQVGGMVDEMAPAVGLDDKAGAVRMLEVGDRSSGVLLDGGEEGLLVGDVGSGGDVEVVGDQQTLFPTIEEHT